MIVFAIRLFPAKHKIPFNYLGNHLLSTFKFHISIEQYPYPD